MTYIQYNILCIENKLVTNAFRHHTFLWDISYYHSTWNIFSSWLTKTCIISSRSVENNTWYAEVAEPKTKPSLNQSLLGTSQASSRCSCPSSLLVLAARELRLHLLLPFCDEHRRHGKWSLLGILWLLNPVGWAVWLRAEVSGGIFCYQAKGFELLWVWVSLLVIGWRIYL